MKKDYSKPDVKINMYKAEDVVAASAVTVKRLETTVTPKYTVGRLHY